MRRIEMKNNLMVITIVSAVATVGVLGTAQAQSKFEGFYGQIGVGYENTHPSLSYGNVNVTGTGPFVGSYPMSSTVGNSNSFAGTVTAGFFFPVNKEFYMGFGAEYSPIAGNTQNFSANGSGLTANGQYNKENSYNIFITPAFPIGDDAMIYAKVGYTIASVKSQYSGGNSTTDSLNGYSVGLGYKQIIQGGFYGFGEINYAKYGDKTINQVATIGTYNLSQDTTMSASTYNLLVGIGYKF